MPIASTAPADTRPLLIHVPGHNPAPQGSKRYVGHYLNPKTGRRTARLREQSDRVKPWRDTVVLYTKRAMAADRRTQPLDGVLRADIIFTMRPPNQRPKNRRIWPNNSHYGDLDKIQRSTFDALKDANAIVDDSRVCEIHTIKLFPGDPGALDSPGAVIRLTRLDMPHAQP